MSTYSCWAVTPIYLICVSVCTPGQKKKSAGDKTHSHVMNEILNYKVKKNFFLCVTSHRPTFISCNICCRVHVRVRLNLVWGPAYVLNQQRESDILVEVGTFSVYLRVSGWLHPCVCMSAFICLSACVCLSVCPSACACLSVCVRASVCLCISVCVPVCLRLCMSACMGLSSYPSVSVCLSVCLWSSALADDSGEPGFWKVKDPWARRWLYAWTNFSHCNTERWRKTRAMATTATTSGKARGPDCSVARCTIVISVEIYDRTVVSGVLRNSLTHW